MSRPQDIPEKLWEAPSTFDIAKMPVGGRELVCRAIMAERDRTIATLREMVEEEAPSSPSAQALRSAVRRFPPFTPEAS